MGLNKSQLPPPPASFPYFSLTFCIDQTIEMIDCNQECLTLIQQVVNDNWPSGIQSQFFDHGAFEIKFRGNPFSMGSGKEEALASKRMCCALLIALHSIGWELCVSSDLSRITDLTTWFFQRNPTLISRRLPAEGGIVCLSLSSHDKLQLVNAPSNLHNELLQCVGPLLQSHEVHGPDFEVKMIGNPWFTTNFKEGVTARHLLLNIFRKFDSFNYRFHGTANLNGTADCIYFEHDLNYTAGETRFCILSLNCSDRIRLIDCPQVVVDAVGQCIKEYWPRGIQNLRQHERCVEYKLKGYPWCSLGDGAINSRFLITHILQSLVAVGWAVMSALDISYRPNDKAVFVLRNCAPASIDHLCISPSDIDLIRLINAPEDVQIVVSGVIHSNWPYGIKRERQRLMAYEWKLNGIPWISSFGNGYTESRHLMTKWLQGDPWSSYGGNDYAMSRYLMTRLLSEMARLGWFVVCSADVSAKFRKQKHGPANSLDVHCWILARTGHAAQLPEAAGTSSAIDFRMPLALSFAGLERADVQYHGQ